MTRALALAALLCSGCLAAAPVGSKLTVSEVYPDEAYATLEAWTEIFGAPRGTDSVLASEVVHGSQEQAHAMCPQVQRYQVLAGCSHLEGGEATIMIVDGMYPADPFVVEHEISHALAALNGIAGGDADHADPRIWGFDGVVHAAAARLGHVVTVAAPSQEVP